MHVHSACGAITSRRLTNGEKTTGVTHYGKRRLPQASAGRVLVETYVTFTKDSVRKRGLEPPRGLPH